MQKEIIYQVMNGYVDLRMVSLPKNWTVVDEFSDGRECGRLYERVYAAKKRLAEKTGESENADVEEIIGCMCRIARVLAMKMYDYGMEAK